jgi:hypothetical protein
LIFLAKTSLLFESVTLINLKIGGTVEKTGKLGFMEKLGFPEVL